MEWSHIAITGGVILAGFGALTIIGNGIKIIQEWTNPMIKIKERTQKLEERADATDEKFDKLTDIINAQSKLLIEISNHMISGNDIEKLKEKRDELTNAIIEK